MIDCCVYADEEGAIRTLKQRLDKAPGFSEDMLRNKVFGAYESDIEFQLVHFASMPLYKEVFDPDAALRSCLDNVYVAESHSKSTMLRCEHKGTDLAKMTCTPRRRNISTT